VPGGGKKVSSGMFGFISTVSLSNQLLHFCQQCSLEEQDMSTLTIATQVVGPVAFPVLEEAATEE
jgi:hypothetical protein